MSWDRSLVRLSTYEVEVQQKHLAEIAARRAAAERSLADMLAQAEVEAERSVGDAESARLFSRYIEGVRARKLMIEQEIHRISLEEAGAREALNQAFEEQKKYELVSVNIQRAKAKKQAQIEMAALDEIGLRRTAAR